jgi:hypothetical protein
VVQENQKLTYGKVQVVKLQAGGTVQVGKDEWAKFTDETDNYTEVAEKGQLTPAKQY